MILKLRIENDNDSERFAWRLLDNIERIDYKYVDDVPKHLDGRIYINRYPDLVDKTIAEISITYRDGNYDYIYTDASVYILNDDGKTCDTINA